MKTVQSRTSRYLIMAGAGILLLEASITFNHALFQAAAAVMIVVSTIYLLTVFRSIQKEVSYWMINSPDYSN